MEDFFDMYKVVMSGHNQLPPRDEYERLKRELEWYDREIAGHLKVTPEFMAKRNAIAKELEELLQRRDKE